MQNSFHHQKLISVVTPCYNEEDNVEKLYQAVKKEFEQLENYDFELIFIDNCSQDKTVAILKEIAQKDVRVKIIVNSRNFGHIRSPFYALLQSTGAASILMASDLQDPPDLIPKFIEEWERGHEIVMGIKNESLETPLMFTIRKAYYYLINKLAEIELSKNFTGFGLYDKKIISILKELNDPYPYFRGVIHELGFSVQKINFVQPARLRGITKNNFYTLYDIAMLGICTHSKIPLRLATLVGFIFSLISFLVAIGYCVAKLLFWNSFSLGIAPLVVGLFFFASIQLLLLGIVGEYVGWIFTRVSQKKLVYEKERINFVTT